MPEAQQQLPTITLTDVDADIKFAAAGDEPQCQNAWSAQPNLNYAEHVTPQVEAAVTDLFAYHRLNGMQTEACIFVRTTLENAYKVVVANVPPSGDRSTALRKIREAKTDCLSAISTGGKY